MALETPLPTRRPLGKFNQKIHEEKLARGIRVFGAPVTPETRKEMFGLYEKGAVLQNCRLKFQPDSNVFYFIREILTDAELRAMAEVPDITIRPGVKRFLSSPFDCEFNQVKLYQDPVTKKVYRCVIEDVYCVQETLTKLALNVDILLLDIGERKKSVRNMYIYDIPQRINYLSETEREAKMARLNLDDNQDHKIFEEFKNHVTRSESNLFEIKICGYDEDSVYRIDVTTTNKSTFLETYDFVSQLKSRSNCHENLSLDVFYEVPKMQPRSIRKLKPIQKHKSDQSSLKRYSCAIDYFRKKLSEQDLKLNEPRNRRRLLEVVPIEWEGIDQITIVPHDDSYYASHGDFVKTLGSLKCMKNVCEDKPVPIKVYKPGQFVIFKNVFGDSGINPWLRGVVVSMCCYNEHGLLIKQRKTLEERQINYYTVVHLVRSGKVEACDLIYRVRSVDYGLECRCSPINMRDVRDTREFKQVGTWTLTCRLFGVHFHQNGNRPPRETQSTFNEWLNQKRKLPRPSGQPTVLSVIFRDDLMSYKPDRDFDKRFEISLFHREKKAGVLQCGRGEVQANFDCVNWYLVEKGLATQHDQNGSSNIQLEDHVMNLMVKHKKI